MTIRVFLLVALLGGCATARPGTNADLAQAVVSRDRLVVTFPPVGVGTTTWPPPSSTSAGFYDWRLGVDGPAGFAASASVHVQEAHAGAAHSSLAQVAPLLRLRRCDSGGHILQCGLALPGEVAAIDTRVLRVTLRDSAIITRLNGLRPAFLWRSVFLPDTILGLDSVRIVYQP